MVLFTNIFDSLAKMEYDADLFGKVSCIHFIALKGLKVIAKLHTQGRASQIDVI